MLSLREQFYDRSRFLCGVELVTTRGAMGDDGGIRTRDLARELSLHSQIDWVSITDNAGGNPMLSPVALGKPLLYSGKQVLIHLSCKDFNRNGLESEAWQLSSEGFHNILALSGDYPTTHGYQGQAKPVFDIDSIGLLMMLQEMNSGMSLPGRVARRLAGTQFFSGAVTTNFKLHENEVMPQYLKLEKKLECGAEFIISQIGYDSRKIHELKAYMDQKGWGHIPLFGNIYLLTPSVARFFHAGRIPGVVVSRELMEESERQGKSPDKGRQFFLELAAKQWAIFRGLGYRGGYFGGVEEVGDIEKILEMASRFSADDWKQFAREIRYARPGEFYYFAEDSVTGLAHPGQLSPEYLDTGKTSPHVDWNYRVSKWMHDQVFTPGKGLHAVGEKIYQSAGDSRQGPSLLRSLEHFSKNALFQCKDCGDCSLPDTAFLCPESQCAKNQRNGPCGGTRDGKCEVEDFDCIWSRAYDRLKHEGRAEELLDHAPVIQDHQLRGTSSWANAFLKKDHHSHPVAAPVCSGQNESKGCHGSAEKSSSQKSTKEKSHVEASVPSHR